MLNKKYLIICLIGVFMFTSCSQKEDINEQLIENKNTNDMSKLQMSENQEEFQNINETKFEKKVENKMDLIENTHLLSLKLKETEIKKIIRALEKTLDQNGELYNPNLIKQMKVYQIENENYILIAPILEDVKIKKDEELKVNVEKFKDVNNEENKLKSLIAKIEVGEKISLTKIYEGNFVVNYDKIEVNLIGNELNIWSQYSNISKDMNAVFDIEDDKIELLNQTESNPTLEYYNEIIELLRKGDIEKVMQIDKEQIYKHNYQDLYFKTATMSVRVAHDYAFLTYKKEDLTEKEKLEKSKKALNWGLNKYLEAQIDMSLPIKDVEKLDDLFLEVGYRDRYKLKKSEFASILNDYAYFKFQEMKYSEAEILMEKVLEYSPNRIVAQINMGDVLWEQKKETEAKLYYEKYVELLGLDNSIIPDRVFNRLDYYNTIKSDKEDE